jgi:hypothetical protein
MSSQTKLIKDILSLYDTILENKEISEATDIYDNVDFRNIGQGNPSSDDINVSLLQDVQTAAKTAGVNVTITTAISGHRPSPRHDSGNAVDIAIINGKAVSPSNKEDAKKFVNALVLMGYTKNVESGNNKSVLTFGFEGHDDHVHVSNKGTSSSSNKSKENGSNPTNALTNISTSYEETKPDPLIMGWGKALTDFLGLEEEKKHINRVRPTYPKKIKENINRIKGLLK